MKRFRISGKEERWQMAEMRVIAERWQMAEMRVIAERWKMVEK